MFKTFLLGLILLMPGAVAVAAGGQSGSGKPQAESGSKAAPKTNAVGGGLPSGAVKAEDGTWRYKDASGKVWIYEKSPFGYSKRSEPAEKPTSEEPTKPPYRVVEVKGDLITFETSNPFGKARWTRKRDEMNKNEKLSLEAYETDSRK